MRPWLRRLDNQLSMRTTSSSDTRSHMDRIRSRHKPKDVGSEPDRSARLPGHHSDTRPSHLPMTLLLPQPHEDFAAWARALRRTYAWKQLAKQVIREEPLCWMQLPGICTRLSTTADHLHPASVRPELALARWNLKGACKACNDKRGNRPVSEIPKVRAKLLAAQANTITKPVARQHNTQRALAFFSTQAARPTGRA